MIQLLRAYAQLLRLPNVFTALADVCLGWLAAREAASIAETKYVEGALPWLLATSACLYSAGMVLNDVFDVDEDRRDRPKRPIPSGRVSRSTAIVIGIMLLAGGVVMAWASGCAPTGPVVAVLLCVAILLYDGVVKNNIIGPLVMGSCRFLNVLLGMAILPALPTLWMWQMAGVVGVYVTGVTVFARTEATMSRRTLLLFGVLIMAVAAAGAVTMPSWWAPSAEWHHVLHPYLMACWAVIVGHTIVAAVAHPEPVNVQRAVKWCILGLIGLDALMACAVVGWSGLLILLLAPPGLVLGRWIYST